MICIRIFKTREEAERAKEVLLKGNFVATVSEDKINNVPIQQYGVQARFRFMIKDRDFLKVTQFLANELNKVNI
jgi:hypothetical protein